MKRDRNFIYVILLAVLVVLTAVLLIMHGRGLRTAPDPVLPADTDAVSPSLPKTQQQSSEIQTAEDTAGAAKDSETGEEIMIDNSAENEGEDISVDDSDEKGHSYVPGVNDTPVIQDSDD